MRKNVVELINADQCSDDFYIMPDGLLSNGRSARAEATIAELEELMDPTDDLIKWINQEIIGNSIDLGEKAGEIKSLVM